MPADGSNDALRVRVMTFNVRFDAPQDAPDHTWDTRREAAAEIVRMHAPDVVGIQEALKHQLRDLQDDLPNYECLGRARELRGGGEFVPLLFLRDRFEVDQWGVFWLSETPDVEGSMGWDADNPRISTWAVLRDRSTSRSFLVINTHLDRWGTLAREASAELLVSRGSRFAGVPLIVAGDLNVTEDDPAFQALQAGLLRDSFRDLHDGTAPSTIHHYGERFGGKIDFVLCDPNWRVLGAEVVLDKPFGRWPSDHYPVTADLELIEDRDA
jgi:endonuclease/exonuclease/phosphatase family metal-dependent hydrolase